MPALRKAGCKLFHKEIISKGYGFHTPQDGSVCKIKVVTDEKQVITDLNDCQEKEIVVGDVDEPVDKILEDCIRTMKEEEECLLKFVHPCLGDDIFIPKDSKENEKNDNDKNDESEVAPEVAKQDENTDEPKTDDDKENIPSESEDSNKEQSMEADKQEEKEEPVAESDAKEEEYVDLEQESHNNVVEVRFQLISYTREPEIWEMSITEKWRRASYHKQRGLELYSRGAYQYAFRRFGLTLKYVISLEHDVPSGQEEGMDIKGLKLSCYLNVAACQMRHHNFESVVLNSSKALSLQPNNAKALYRRGSAYLQLQEYEKAKEDLDLAQQLEPKNQAVAKQQQLLKCQVQKLNQYYASAMKKLFS